MQGAFTFAVGPNPGPAPQFVIPHIAQTATTTPLAGRALGAVPDGDDRDRPARPPARDRAARRARACRGHEPARRSRSRSRSPRRSGSSRSRSTSRSRRRSTRCARSSTSARSCRSGATTAFGRGYVDLLALLRAVLRRRLRSRSGSTGPSASTARSPSSSPRSASSAAAAAVLADPGRRRPRRADLAARPRASRSTGSTWLGLALARRPGRAARALAEPARPPAASPCSPVVVPRFSNVAFVSVLVLLGSGIWAAVLHLPILSALWTTSLRPGDPASRPGCSRLAMLLARRQPPPDEAASRGRRDSPELGRRRRGSCGALVSGEAVLVVGRGLRGRAALEPRAALEVPRRGGLGARQGRPGPGRRDRAPGRAIR